MNGLRPKLLPRSAAIGTGFQDVPSLNYHPVLGLISRLRFGIVLSLLPKKRFPRLLEVGYGSGIFQPELAQHCDQLYGVDVHPFARRVSRNLQAHQVDAHLMQGDGIALPFADQSFDCVLAMSCMEYMDPLDQAAQEMRRILKPDGTFLCVTPGNSPVIDFGHDLLTGRSVRHGYGDRRSALLPTLSRYFTVQEERTMPRFGGRLMTLYRGYRLGLS